MANFQNPLYIWKCIDKDHEFYQKQLDDKKEIILKKNNTEWGIDLNEISKYEIDICQLLESSAKVRRFILPEVI